MYLISGFGEPLSLMRNYKFLLFFQAELYRVNKLYNKAEPLYLEAISILEESFGPEDIRYTMILLQTMMENAYMFIIYHAFVLINLLNAILMTQYVTFV